MEFRGTQVCNKCHKEFKWLLHTPDHIDSTVYRVVKLDANQAQFISNNDNEYDLRVRCSHCDELNEFRYNV